MLCVVMLLLLLCFLYLPVSGASPERERARSARENSWTLPRAGVGSEMIRSIGMTIGSTLMDGYS